MSVLDAQWLAARAGEGARFRLIFRFDVDTPAQGPVKLVMEHPEQFRTWVNGREIEWRPNAEWWIDPAFRAVEVTDAVRAGQNEVIVSGVMTRLTELEVIYLTGAFGVTSNWIRRENELAGQVFDRYSREFRICAPPAEVRASAPFHPLRYDLTASGFPFFAGRVTLARQVDLPAVPPRLSLEIQGLRAALVNVSVNGLLAGTSAWEPHRVPIAALAKPGANDIEVELVGTLRNLLGPHHLAGGDPSRTNPEHFRDKTRWTDDYLLTPFGWEQVRLCW